MSAELTSLPITDAINGETVEVWPHRHWVCVGYGDGEDAWLTPIAARRLAAALLDAADDAI